MGPSRVLVPCKRTERPDVLVGIGAGLVVDCQIGKVLIPLN